MDAFWGDASRFSGIEFEFVTSKVSIRSCNFELLLRLFVFHLSVTVPTAGTRSWHTGGTGRGMKDAENLEIAKRDVSHL